MKTKKNSYGSVITIKSENSVSYQVQFHNPLLNEIEIRETFRNKEEAQSFLYNCNFDFFDKHSNLLPRGISLNRRDKRFVFCVTIRNKSIRISSSIDLDKVCEDKFLFAQSFLS